MLKIFLVSKPGLPKILPAAAAVTELEPAATLESAEYDHPAWAGQSSPRLTLETARLLEPDLTSARLREGAWVDVEVFGGQLSALDLTGTSWRRLHISKSRLSGAVFAEAEIKDVTFTGAKLDLANFRMAQLRRVHFVGCQLTEAAFGGAKLTEVVFTDCDLTGAEFSGAVLREVDMRSSVLASIHGLAGLKNAIINTQQMIGLLPEFAAELGIQVKND